MGKVVFTAKLWRLFVEARCRYKAAYGGRGAAKSWAAADALIVRAFNEPLRILCAREFQRSIGDSVHHLLDTQIDRLGLSAYFDVQQTSIKCRLNGSNIIFAGLKHNIRSLKSLEGIDICWVEEAEAVSETSWSYLIPTIRKPGSEIWVTFNPDQESDPTYRRFVEGQPDFDPKRTQSVKVSWRDNPALSDVLRAELEHLRRVDPDAYQNVWEGGTWSRSEAQVFNGKWVIDDFVPVTSGTQPAKNWDGPYFGADWGFSQDPTVLVKMWVHDKRLYIEHEAYGIGVDIVSTPALFDRVPDSRRYVIRADCARPEMEFRFFAATSRSSSIQGVNTPRRNSGCTATRSTDSRRTSCQTSSLVGIMWLTVCAMRCSR
jgi:phage terminase large subunit